MITLAQRLGVAQRPFSAPLSLAAPIKGWNTRDEFDAMDPLDAVVLDNFFPDVTGVTVRTGSAPYATGMGSAAVETLAEFRSGATAKFLAACGGSIFDISAAGAAGAAIGSGFFSNRWQTTNFLSRLFLANGQDNLQIYDGSTLADSTFTGVSISTLVGIAQYQQRLFFWQNNSPGFWYAPLNSISGALNFYDLSPFCPRGANLVSVTTVTHDGGNGVLDFIAFIMSSGDMLLYFGNDPSLASNWQQIGRYRVSPPVNIRAITTYGADSFVATFDDYMPLQQQLVALKLGQLPPRSKISGAVQAAIAANGSAFGWQMLYYPKRRSIIANVPNVDGTFDQHVCNTALPTQPWCRYTGMNGHCWSLYGNGLFFGMAGGVVSQADIGFDDDGTPVVATAQQAWNRVNTASRKRMTAVRPIVSSNQGTYDFAIGFDYGDLNIPEATDLSGAALTDDSGADITDDADVPITVGVSGITTRWHASGGTGTAFGFGLSVQSDAQTSWYRTDFRLEVGIGL